MDENFAHPLLSQFWRMNNRVFLLGSNPGEDLLGDLFSEGTRQIFKRDLVQVALDQGYQDGRRGPGIVSLHVLRFDAVPLTFNVAARGVPGAFAPLRDLPEVRYEHLWFDADALVAVYAELWLGLKRRYQDGQIDGERMGMYSHYYFDVSKGQVPTVICIEHGAVTHKTLPRPPAS